MIEWLEWKKWLLHRFSHNKNVRYSVWGKKNQWNSEFKLLISCRFACITNLLSDTHTQQFNVFSLQKSMFSIVSSLRNNRWLNYFFNLLRCLSFHWNNARHILNVIWYFFLLFIFLCLREKETFYFQKSFVIHILIELYGC